MAIMLAIASSWLLRFIWLGDYLIMQYLPLLPFCLTKNVDKLVDSEPVLLAKWLKNTAVSSLRTGQGLQT